MTALLGLSARLRLARVLVRVDAGTAADSVHDQALRRVGLVVLDGAVDATAWGRVSGLASGRRGPLLGLAGDAGDAVALQPDVVLDPAQGPGWPHPWALRGATVSDVGDRAEGSFDFIVLARDPAESGRSLVDAVSRAVRLAPPNDLAAVPWFVQVADSRRAGAAVAAGAVRLAVSGADPALVQRVDELTARAWRTESMRTYRLAAFTSQQVRRSVQRLDTP